MATLYFTGKPSVAPDILFSYFSPGRAGMSVLPAR